jgi:D-alanine-D-alanine ligase
VAAARLVVVLVPQPESIDPEIAYYADYSQSHDELARAFDALAREWRWVPVTCSTVDGILDALVADAHASGVPLPVVLNLCDGDESNAVPGVEVIEALEARGLPYTGSSAPFYRLTTSKVPMKAAFDVAGVPTATWHAMLPTDAPHEVLARTGTPAIVKPAVSAGSMGVSTSSVVHTPSALAAQAASLHAGYHGWDLLSGGVLVERYIAGREFTVLLVGDARDAERLLVYTPTERVFHESLPPTERFLSYDRLWEVYEQETAMPNGEHFWEYAPVAGEFADDLVRVSLAAYEAVHGQGYGRVDIRQCAESGALFVLEVNAQCALSEDENYTSVGAILRFAGATFAELIDRLLYDAVHRHASMNRARRSAVA